MKKFALTTAVLLVTVCFLLRSDAQGTTGGIGNDDVTNEPLSLFISGAGGVTPLQDGESLVVGQTYDLTAVPDSGSQFISWNPVNVFVFSQITVNADGSVNPPVISEVLSPGPEYSTQPMLEFVMQPTQVIFNNPGVETITESEGWQANFAPAPEPSGIALTACGLAIIALSRRRRRGQVSARRGSCFVSDDSTK